MNITETLTKLTEKLATIEQAQKDHQRNWEQMRLLLDKNGPHFQAITTHIAMAHSSNRALTQMVGILVDILQIQEQTK